MTNRPLSPHLQVYKPQLTSLLSIAHRMSGVVLAIGTPLLVWWFVAVAAGSDTYESAQGFFSSGLGRLVLLMWSFALFYHLCNGIRHLLWDIGWGFELTAVYKSGWTVVAGSVVLTLVSWVWAYVARGGGS